MATWHDPNAVAGRGQDEFAQFFISVSIVAADSGQAGIVHRIFEMQVKLLITPRGVAGQLGLQKI
jgi:hypothetical protein